MYIINVEKNTLLKLEWVWDLRYFEIIITSNYVLVIDQVLTMDRSTTVRAI